MGDDYPYVYVWRPSGGESSRKGQRCRILARAPHDKFAFNSVLIEFGDGTQYAVRRNAIRRFYDGAEREAS